MLTGSSAEPLPVFNGPHIRHRCGHDGQRKGVAHMPTATTAAEGRKFKMGSKRSQNHPLVCLKSQNTLFAYLSFACCSKFVSARCRNRETSKYLVEQCGDLGMSTEVFTSFLQITDSKRDIVSGAEISVCNVGTTTLRHQPWPQKNSLM